MSLESFRGRPLLVTLMRGLQCPFCRRNLAVLDRMAPALRDAGLETVAIIGTTAQRTRLRFRDRPVSIALGADLDLATHRDWGSPAAR